MTAHLTHARIEAALHGDGAAAKWVAVHLEESCEACEQLLSEWDGGVLEGEVDRALLAPIARPATTTPMGFASVYRAVHPSRRAAMSWTAVGLAASLAFAALTVPHGSGRQRGTKGLEAVSLELSAAARAPGGTLRRVEPGGWVWDDEVLVLRCHATDGAHALLVEQQQGSGPVALMALELRPGTQDLMAGEGLAGITASVRERAPTLAVVAGMSAPPSLADAVSALRGEPPPGVAIARFPFQVKSRHHPDRN